MKREGQGKRRESGGVSLDLSNFKREGKGKIRKCGGGSLDHI